MNSNSTTSRPLQFLLVLTFLGMLLCFWNCDDAFISFRYARNLAHGLGLTFNPGTDFPVEGFSNFLWVLVAAVVELLGFPPHVILPFLSIACGIYLTIRVHQFLIQKLQITPLPATALTATMSLAPPFLVWATSGLATMPFSLLLFLFFEHCFSEKPLRTSHSIVLVSGLCLIRAEGFAWALVILGLGFFFSQNRSYLLRTLVPVLGGVLLTLFLARYFYFGYFLPNTASAKVGFSMERLLRGGDYIIVYLLTFITPILAFLTFFTPFRLLKQKSIFAASLLFAGIFSYAVLVGGDYMSMGRFLLPSLPFQAILFGYLLRSKPRLTLYVAPLLTIIGLTPLFNIYLVPHAVRSNFHFRLNRSNFVDENRHWQFMKENSMRWRTKGERIARFTSPGESLVEGAIGNVGYFSDRIIFDRMGLVTRIPASASPESLRSPGHDVRVPASFFLPEKPTYLYARAMGERRVAGLLKQKKQFPYPYAPVVFDLGIKEEDRFFVLMKRHENKESFLASWEKIHRLAQEALS